VKLRVTVEGKTYEVDVEPQDPMPAPARGYSPRSVDVAAPPPLAAAPVSDSDRVCKSPIAGTVIRVNIAAGQEVKTEDRLMVLEAMKMETNITAPFDGKVKTLKVQEGESVQGGQVLVEFE
jgi:methylmalonyl-CoA carboxyltransferase 1.3S subunit